MYSVTSLYYDTADYKAYRDKVNGEKFRRKVRVRVYGEQSMTPDSTCFLEIKQRINQMINKKRVLLPLASVLTLENVARSETGTLAVDAPTGNGVWQEVEQLFQTLQLQPACLVQYNRAAFESHEAYPDLRVTFDTSLRYRTYALSLLKDDQAAYAYFLAPDCCIIEVKVNRSMPYWLATALTKHGCRLRRISKYCAALEHSQVVRLKPLLTVPVESLPPAEPVMGLISTVPYLGVGLQTP